jgi:hypothetical protein
MDVELDEKADNEEVEDEEIEANVLFTLKSKGTKSRPSQKEEDEIDIEMCKKKKRKENGSTLSIYFFLLQNIFFIFILERIFVDELCVVFRWMGFY